MICQTIQISVCVAVALLSGCASKPNNGLHANDLGVGNTPPKTALAFVADKNFGNSLNRSDKLKLSEAEFRALNYGSTGVPLDWKGSSEDTTGSVVVFQLFKVGKSRCRRFQHRVLIATKRESVAGTACIRESGAWELID